MSRFRTFALHALAAALAAGCATTRGTLDVRVAEVANPATGLAVAIAEVRDERVFEWNPWSPATPSLMGNEIGDPAFTSRALARKYNIYGQAKGDILLPEGRTVEQLTREVVTGGLRGAGFRVLVPGDAGYARAVPLEIRILRFWSWVDGPTYPNTTAYLNFAAHLAITGAIAPFDDGEELEQSIRVTTVSGAGRSWHNAIDQGLAALEAEIRTRLEAFAEASPQ